MERYSRFVERLGLGEADAALLTSERDIADYFEAVLAAGAEPHPAANWVANEWLRLTGTGVGLSAHNLANLIRLVQEGRLSGKMAKEVFVAIFATDASPLEYVERHGLVQVSDEAAIEKLAREVVAAHPRQVEKFKQGQEKLLGFFVGQVMKATGGKANPETVNRVLKALLDE
jgi:aspartyl-tRNA(Asn)/glutamyl-tRNA(Gln) amidotransferase subunit B